MMTDGGISTPSAALTGATSGLPGAPASKTPGTYTSIIPGLDVYGPQALAANTAYQKALAQVNLQRSGLLRQYGYTGQIDPNSGSISSLAVDPHNPYGSLQQMLNMQAQEDSAGLDAAHARGLQGGLANQGATALKYAHGAQSAQLGTQLFSGIAGLQGSQDDAYSSMENALWQAQLAQAQLAIQNQQFNPADPGPPPEDNSAPATSKPSDNGGKGQASTNSSKPGAKKKPAAMPAPTYAPKPAQTSSAKQKLAKKMAGGGGGGMRMV